MSKKEKLDRFHYHEALDRAYIVCNIVDSFLLKHPVIQKHKVLKKKVEKAVELLSDVYLLTGTVELRNLL